MSLEAVLTQELSDHATRVSYVDRGKRYPGYYHNPRFLPTVISKPIYNKLGWYLLGIMQHDGQQRILFACSTREQDTSNLS